MAPNLRSTSRATSSNSRQSTPLTLAEPTGPRKLRRTGRTSRAVIDLGTAEPEQGPASSSGKEEDLTGNDTQPPRSPVDWIEPPLKAPAPSYRDTPWSAVSSDKNPVLATMRPLGVGPTATDLRKAGLASVKTTSRSISRKRKAKALVGDEDEAERPGSASSSVGLDPPEEPSKELSQPGPGEDTSGDIADDVKCIDFAMLPVPQSTEYDVEKIGVVVRLALEIADRVNNVAVSRGLRRLWGDSSKEPFYLSVLNSVLKRDPARHQQSVFKTIMRTEFKNVQSSAAAMSRTHSAESTSSLSSAKTVDVDPLTTAPGTRGRAPPGEETSAAVSTGRSQILAPEPAQSSLPPSLPPAVSSVPPLDPVKEYDAVSRARLQQDMPVALPRESRVRSSLRTELRTANRQPSPRSTPPTAGNQDQDPPHGVESTVSPPHRDADQGSNDRAPRLSRDGNQENTDFCRECNGTGQLLCCDGCINSYHFSCLRPPLDPAHAPEGQWFCPACCTTAPLKVLLDGLKSTPQRGFQLPAETRNYFEGVRTGPDGKYEEVAVNTIHNGRGKGARSLRADEQHHLRLFDAKGKLIVCVACGRTTNAVRPIIQCDYCACSWHMDCVDPPLAIRPNQKPGSDKRYHNWMCPNHTQNDLCVFGMEDEGTIKRHRIRRPRHPRVIDVDVLPEDSDVEQLEERESQYGIVFRVSELGIKQEFIDKVKRENDEAQLHADAVTAAAAQYSRYSEKKMDDLVATATAFYSSQNEAEPAVSAILNSRSAAEREAVMSLVSFAQDNWDINNLQSNKIDLLVDQLMAEAPSDLPRAETEIQSLRALQELIGRRLDKLAAAN